MWYYVDNGQQQGPFDEAQFEELIAGGSVNPGTYVWKEGQPNWLPLGQVRGVVAQGDTCQVCQKPVGSDNLIELSGVRVCAACKPVALQSLREGIPWGGDGVWADGKKIVTCDGAHFPQRCVKCNVATSGEPLKRKLYWHSPWFYLLILTPYMGIIAYIIGAIIVRKRATIYVHVCPAHRQRRIYSIIGSWLAILLGFGLMIAAGVTTNNWWILAGLTVIVLAVILGVTWGRMTVTTRIDKDKTVRLKGAGKDFIASLPPWNGS